MKPVVTPRWRRPQRMWARAAHRTACHASRICWPAGAAAEWITWRAWRSPEIRESSGLRLSGWNDVLTSGSGFINPLASSKALTAVSTRSRWIPIPSDRQRCRWRTSSISRPSRPQQGLKSRPCCFCLWPRCSVVKPNESSTSRAATSMMTPLERKVAIWSTRSFRPGSSRCRPRQCGPTRRGTTPVAGSRRAPVRSSQVLAPSFLTVYPSRRSASSRPPCRSPTVRMVLRSTPRVTNVSAMVGDSQ